MKKKTIYSFICKIKKGHCMSVKMWLFESGHNVEFVRMKRSVIEFAITAYFIVTNAHTL